MFDWKFESVNEEVDGGYTEFKKSKYGKEINDGGNIYIYIYIYIYINYSSTFSSSDCHLT